VILETQGLSFAYGKQPVLKAMDLRIKPGVTAIIGPNAAGKSTLLRCLCGLLKPQGEVFLDGRNLTDFPSHELTPLVSYLPQNLPPRAALTVFETVLLGRLSQLGWRVSPADALCVERLLDDMNLSSLAHRYIGELSGGQLQMVAIAQALVREPAVLLMDEPTSNLDLRHQFEICSLIRRLTDARGMSTALALHDLNVAARFADTVYVLAAGSVCRAGTPEAVLTEEMIASVYGVQTRVSPDIQGKPAVTILGLA
jgi:iron complex transport system ATP-binding protein